MRHIFIADIHGRYDKLTEALAGVNFNAEQDMLVCLGDIFDRGEQSLEVLQYLMGLPNRKLIWGNHDYRLRELILGRPATSADYSNGVLETLQSFCPYHNTGRSIDILISIFMTDERYKATYELLWKYFNECVWCIEWENLIAVHGWLPHEAKIADRRNGKIEYKLTLDSNWRAADRDAWYDASWAHTEMCCRDNIFPDKGMIVGHWHAWRLHCAFSTFAYHNAPFTPFIAQPFGREFIAIDGCSNADGGLVNAFVRTMGEPIAVYNPPRS